jgi:hypothetical protein
MRPMYAHPRWLRCFAMISTEEKTFNMVKYDLASLDIRVCITYILYQARKDIVNAFQQSAQSTQLNHTPLFLP